MANYYVRASNDLPAGSGQTGTGNPKHMPFPGYRYDAADAEAAANAHLAAFPTLAAGTKLLVVAEEAIVAFVVTPPAASASTLPTYT